MMIIVECVEYYSTLIDTRMLRDLKEKIYTQDIVNSLGSHNGLLPQISRRSIIVPTSLLLVFG